MHLFTHRPLGFCGVLLCEDRKLGGLIIKGNMRGDPRGNVMISVVR